MSFVVRQRSTASRLRFSLARPSRESASPLPCLEQKNPEPVSNAPGVGFQRRNRWGRVGFLLRESEGNGKIFRFLLNSLVMASQERLGSLPPLPDPQELAKIQIEALQNASKEQLERLKVMLNSMPIGFRPLLDEEQVPPPASLPSLVLPNFPTGPQLDPYRLTSQEEKQLKEAENNPNYKKILAEVEKRLPSKMKDRDFLSQADIFFKRRTDGVRTIAVENLGLREVSFEEVGPEVVHKVSNALGEAKIPPYKLIFVESNIPGQRFISHLQSIEDFILVNHEWAKTVSPEHLAAVSAHEKHHHVPDRLDLYRNILIANIVQDRGLNDKDSAMLIALGEIAHDKKAVQDLQRRYQGQGLIMLLDFFLQSLMMFQDPGPSFKIRISSLKREIARLSLASK